MTLKLRESGFFYTSATKYNSTLDVIVWSKINEGKANQTETLIGQVKARTKRCHDPVSAQPIHLDGKAVLHINEKGIVLLCKDKPSNKVLGEDEP